MEGEGEARQEPASGTIGQLMSEMGGTRGSYGH